MSTSPPLNTNDVDGSKSDEDLEQVQDPHLDSESENTSPKSPSETDAESNDLDVDVNFALLQESAPIAGESIEIFERKWTVWGRMLLGGSMILILAGIIFLTLAKGMRTGWEQTYEAFQFIFPAVTGLIGSVMGFYFGTFETNNVVSSSVRKKSTSPE